MDKSEDIFRKRRWMVDYLAIVMFMERKCAEQNCKAVDGYSDWFKSMRYASVEEFVLFNGSVKHSYVMRTHLPRMLEANCFENATRVSISDPTMTYVEGFASFGQDPIPTHHAWLEGPDGTIHDPTWKDVLHRNAMSGNVNQPEVAYYAGVRIETDAHMAWIDEHETPNILCIGDLKPIGLLQGGYDHLLQPLKDREGYCPGELRERALEHLDDSATWFVVDGQFVSMRVPKERLYCDDTDNEPCAYRSYGSADEPAQGGECAA